jgi:predicted 3-demethylubiquinone-9 3-methyltransferase (glyoxalase superfamily)
MIMDHKSSSVIFIIFYDSHGISFQYVDTPLRRVMTSDTNLLSKLFQMTHIK